MHARSVEGWMQFVGQDTLGSGGGGDSSVYEGRRNRKGFAEFWNDGRAWVDGCLVELNGRTVDEVYYPKTLLICYCLRKNLYGDSLNDKNNMSGFCLFNAGISASYPK